MNQEPNSTGTLTLTFQPPELGGINVSYVSLPVDSVLLKQRHVTRTHLSLAISASILEAPEININFSLQT